MQNVGIAFILAQLHPLKFLSCWFWFGFLFCFSKNKQIINVFFCYLFVYNLQLWYNILSQYIKCCISGPWSCFEIWFGGQFKTVLVPMQACQKRFWAICLFVNPQIKKQVICVMCSFSLCKQLKRFGFGINVLFQIHPFSHYPHLLALAR